MLHWPGNFYLCSPPPRPKPPPPRPRGAPLDAILCVLLALNLTRWCGSLSMGETLKEKIRDTASPRAKLQFQLFFSFLNQKLGGVWGGPAGKFFRDKIKSHSCGLGSESQTRGLAGPCRCPARPARPFPFANYSVTFTCHAYRPATYLPTYFIAAHWYLVHRHPGNTYLVYVGVLDRAHRGARFASG